MTVSTRPFITLYVAWHPDFDDGESIAKLLYNHYRRNLYENVAGGTGLSVIYRFQPLENTNVPLDIDFDGSNVTAIVMLIDNNWVADEAFVQWGKSLMDSTDQFGLGARVFPVIFNDAAIGLNMAEQAIRWDRWKEEKDRESMLIQTLTYQLCRMLRVYLESLDRPNTEEESLQQYLCKVEIFLSHSKHDEFGERIAREIRKKLFLGDGLESFFDVHDIPAGLRFDQVILIKLKTCAVVAIHTDSYSSREWCRREIIEAKRWSVPLVVVDCIDNTDERSFPYMGNVPLVRMDPRKSDRIDYVVKTLLDEVLKDFLWKCRIKISKKFVESNVKFLPRPPELISLINSPVSAGDAAVFIYPDPPISDEEKQLFVDVAPNVKLSCLTEWIAEEGL